MSSEINQKNIRNFCIISHVDHGKSTLADRFLELTGTIDRRKMREQFLDMMELEREKGITIKLQPVRMIYKANKTNKSDKPDQSDGYYIFNLIDTPGHVDFSYEVSRSLAAVDGAILLVDATKGIQAQTIANLHLAHEEGLTIIPAINKIDLPQARIKEVKAELADILKIAPEDIFEISAKEGTNIETLLRTIVQRIPPPCGNPDAPPRALIFDSKFDAYKGVVAYVRVADGVFKQGEKIILMAQNVEGEAKEVGYFLPEPLPQKELYAGEIGYIATGIKEPGKVRVGDTITISKIKPEKSRVEPRVIFMGNHISKIPEPLPGYKEPKPMVFMSFFPENADDFDILRDALAKLHLEDSAFTFELESEEALGRGFRCGFLGLLHGEIISERLRRESHLRLVVTTPSVSYKALLKDGKEYMVYTPHQWPNETKIEKVFEPWIKIEVMAPLNYIGHVHTVLSHIRSIYKDTLSVGIDRVLILYEIPLSELMTNLYDKLKGATAGYASVSYEPIGYREGELVRLDIFLAGELHEAFSQIVPKERAYDAGKRLTEKLKEILPRQQFSLAIQAVAGGKVIARETLGAIRKDVTGYLYGGDYTRKRKLLEKQKRGKRELREKGRVRVPASVFLTILKLR